MQIPHSTSTSTSTATSTGPSFNFLCTVLRSLGFPANFYLKFRGGPVDNKNGNRMAEAIATAQMPFPTLAHIINFAQKDEMSFCQVQNWGDGDRSRSSSLRTNQQINKASSRTLLCIGSFCGWDCFGYAR